MAMPKNAIYTSNRTKHPEQTEHHRQDTYLLTQRQAVTHQNEHEPKQHQCTSRKPTKCTAPRQRKKNPIKDAKGTSIETTPKEPGTPNTKSTVKATTPPADRATKRQAAIIYYKAFSFPDVKGKKKTTISGGSLINP